MGLASALNAPQMGLRWAPPPGGDRVLLGRRRAHLALPPRLPSRSASTLVFSRRRNRNSIVTSSPKKNKNKLQRLGGNGAVAAEGEEEIDEDAFEALFRQLEEDLKKDDPSLFDGDDDDDEEISEEDLAKLDEQLAEVFDMTGYDDESEDDVVVEIEEEEEEEEDEEEDEEEEQPLTLKNWQLRRLASALKIGRRKANIKNLAAELCLDRAIVLELLRNPPPNLLMMSAALPDHEPSPTITITEVKTIETEVNTVETVMERTATPKPDTAEKVPVHVMQQRFSNQKRLKKAHLQTLEDIYRRTKRPTNAMISSIVHVTNLPRKRIVKWFEDKRSEEGVPEQRIPYQRSVPDSVQ